MATKQKEKLAGWGNFPVSESYNVYPSTEAEVKKAVKQGGVVPRGLGRSYGDQAINGNGKVAICTHLNHFLGWDEKGGILECEAGVSLEEIINVFGPKGWLPMICPGTKFVTIGGAIANDIHGKAHHVDGSFFNCVISFTVMLANGTVVTASRDEYADLFEASFGGLGLLGVILTAKIRLRKIETTYFKQKSIKVKNLEEMLKALEEYGHFNYSVAWVDALAKGGKLGSGVLTVGDAAGLNDLPASLRKEPLKIHKKSKLTVPFFLPGFLLNGLTVRMLNRVIAFVQNSPKEFIHYEKFFFPLDMINNWNKGYGKRGFIQYQFVIPPGTEGAENVRKIMAMIASSGCTPFLNVFKKMGDGQGILSFPFEGYTLAIDFPVTKNLRSFTRKMDEEVLKAGGRIYLGKDSMLDKDMFQAMYPQYEQWIAIKRKYDPENVFTSDIGRRLGLQS
jgi:decaprenylphospho-beta-D-ribofuranose 2-oxidase